MAEIDKQFICELIDAAVKDHPKAESLLRQYPGLRDARYIHGETILHFLAIENFTDAVRFLGRLGFDPNATSEFGESPLMDAATVGNLEMAKALLDLGADPNATSEPLDNVLHCAVQSGNAQLVELLLGAGGRMDYMTDIGETALYTAAECGHTEIALLLLQRGQNVNASSWPGTPLAAAASSIRVSMVRLLLDHGADAKAKDDEGRTPLHQAVRQSGEKLSVKRIRAVEKIIELLIGAGADVNARNVYGKTPLEEEAGCGESIGLS